jgi:hypothetical protein
MRAVLHAQSEPTIPKSMRQNRCSRTSKWNFARSWTMALDREQKKNYVRCLFTEDAMFRAVVEEAAALTSLALFVGMIAVWVQVLAAL